MINQQLVDFIKREIQLGKMREKISEELLSGNWTSHDIKEAFNTIDLLNPNLNVFVNVPVPDTKKHFNFKKFFIILLIFSLKKSQKVSVKEDFFEISFYKNKL